MDGRVGKEKVLGCDFNTEFDKLSHEQKLKFISLVDKRTRKVSYRRNMHGTHKDVKYFERSTTERMILGSYTPNRSCDYLVTLPYTGKKKRAFWFSSALGALKMEQHPARINGWAFVP